MSERLRTVARKALEIKEVIKYDPEAPTTTYRLADDRYYTEVKPQFITLLKQYGYNPYGKVIKLHSFENLNPNILKADALVHEKSRNTGFITSPLGDEGNVDLWNYFQKFQTPADNPILPFEGPKFDLAPKTEVISRLETIVSSEPKIIFPDICSGGNVVVDSKGNPYILDVGGMQVDEYSSDGYSANKLDHIIKDNGIAKQKYLDYNKTPKILYTKELDKASMLILYFEIAYGIHLEDEFAQICDRKSRAEVIDALFKRIGFVNEVDLAQKLWKLFETTQENEWLGSTVADIADKYRIERYYEKSVNPQTPWIINFEEKRRAIRR